MAAKTIYSVSVLHRIIIFKLLLLETKIYIKKDLIRTYLAGHKRIFKIFFFNFIN